ncbi:formate-dependent phosphoribosylglycinamide formyltransferase [Erythrobacter litoralis]|uniref:Formate-dependent phosphoribosylglycinamide formyltransferase n=1 Tax=Erythrobacter litoralis (strain HTCC2594) TaxID=314225 RepID=PURT_ERYLH|nr:formate-dependent phosphoribosylglycinamide formyltransferase [Erythrobacter litoralis]Q2N8K3.1 RecName: Full=Formate-dependent phosphoribosylglycinamide formyltransferase; AltName: Full=5'-phosphoribosylglycinamide transformylase 2; AltName: Full=Formate-dependent GAR transformylase; AltName: Full=GAR transformylase 2; Short=GART 2; AltName: Full=Non-folate glycinamide ribonucleotide transformylase; AltName: Full=Phosphoribosylglycinamide formyltransferase 2 [Erythrobacter litoralis HTCC2594]
MPHTAKILLLGSGELGREFVISAKRLGAYVVACDAYAAAPAMQVADASEVLSMLDADALRAVVAKHHPDYVVPEIEAIRTEVLAEIEADGFNVVPSAYATQMTMNRDAIRDLAAQELGITTSRYRYAKNLEEVRAAAEFTGYPCVIKPVMSSSGKGQSTVRSADKLEEAWDYAVANMRGDRKRVIVEQFIDFDYEITLLTVRHKDGITFCPPIGHRQERGDYRESWQPATMSKPAIAAAQEMAEKVVTALQGNGKGFGLFGVEFFVKGEEVIFSELSPRPHDTGMVTSVSQNLSEFDLHARAIMGLHVPSEILARPSASAVILAEQESETVSYSGLAAAMEGGADIRIFGKPNTRPYRRMGVALATGGDTDYARTAAVAAANKLHIHYGD